MNMQAPARVKPGTTPARAQPGPQQLIISAGLLVSAFLSAFSLLLLVAFRFENATMLFVLARIFHFFLIPALLILGIRANVDGSFAFGTLVTAGSAALMVDIILHLFHYFSGFVFLPMYISLCFLVSSGVSSAFAVWATVGLAEGFQVVPARLPKAAYWASFASQVSTVLSSVGIAMILLRYQSMNWLIAWLFAYPNHVVSVAGEHPNLPLTLAVAAGMSSGIALLFTVLSFTFAVPPQSLIAWLFETVLAIPGSEVVDLYFRALNYVVVGAAIVSYGTQFALALYLSVRYSLLQPAAAIKKLLKRKYQ